jgi:hypothetical protein
MSSPTLRTGSTMMLLGLYRPGTCRYWRRSCNKHVQCLLCRQYEELKKKLLETEAPEWASSDESSPVASGGARSGSGDGESDQDNSVPPAGTPQAHGGEDVEMTAVGAGGGSGIGSPGSEGVHGGNPHGEVHLNVDTAEEGAGGTDSGGPGSDFSDGDEDAGEAAAEPVGYRFAVRRMFPG